MLLEHVHPIPAALPLPLAPEAAGPLRPKFPGASPFLPSAPPAPAFSRLSSFLSNEAESRLATLNAPEPEPEPALGVGGKGWVDDDDDDAELDGLEGLL